MREQRKDEGPRRLVAGRVEELKRLEAAERGLVEAFCVYARAAAGDVRLLHLADRHRQLAALLAERITELGGVADEDSDDQWIIGAPDQLETIVYAERAAQRTFHDHLIDLDPDTMRLVRDRILPAHEEALALLTGERGLMQQSLEHG